jgi:hypothetical protein
MHLVTKAGFAMSGWLLIAPCVAVWAAEPLATNRGPREIMRGRTNLVSSEGRSAERREKLRGVNPDREEREKWREQLRNLSPEAREARLKELRQKYGFDAPSRNERQKLREEWEKLSPEERQARLQQWREKRSGDVQFTPEEREAQRRQLAERLARQIDQLRQKGTNSVLTAAEKSLLERLEEISRRFGRSDAAGENAPGPNPGPPGGQ